MTIKSNNKSKPVINKRHTLVPPSPKTKIKMIKDKTYRPMPIFLNNKKIDIKQVTTIEKSDITTEWIRNISLLITMDDGEIYQYNEVFDIQQTSKEEMDHIIKKYNEIYALIEPYARDKETILFYNI